MVEKLDALTPEQRYEFKLQSPFAWWMTALQLKVASDTLRVQISKDSKRVANLVTELNHKGFPDGAESITGAHIEAVVDHHQNSVSIMLLGMAMENYLKGTIVARQRSLLQEVSIPKIHDLVSLAVTAGVPVDQKERDLLANLSFHVTWAGRYPLPAKMQNLRANTSDSTLEGHVAIREIGRAVDHFILKVTEVALNHARKINPSQSE